MVRAALIEQGYLPLAQPHTAGDLACLGDGYPCGRWPEIFAFGGVAERWDEFVFADRRHEDRPRRRRLLIVTAKGMMHRVSGVRFADQGDRAGLRLGQLMAKDEREHGPRLPDWLQSH